MSQQERKAQESGVVRRLTRGAGAAALGLAGYFTVSAATAAPMVFGAQPAGVGPQPAGAAEALDDRVFVRRVHVPAPRPSAAGVKSATTARAATGGRAVSAQAGVAQPAGTTTQQTQAAGPAPAPAPKPPPAAATGGSTPAK
jgi:hypothetical protein